MTVNIPNDLNRILESSVARGSLHRQRIHTSLGNESPAKFEVVFGLS